MIKIPMDKDTIPINGLQLEIPNIVRRQENSAEKTSGKRTIIMGIPPTTRRGRPTAMSIFAGFAAR